MKPQDFTPATAGRAAPSMPVAGRGAPRPDLYGPIHKALRASMADTLCRIGALDVDDAGELAGTLEQADALLALLAGHLKHENEFIHPAIEARQPGAAHATVHAHDEHVASIQALQEEIAALREAPAAARTMHVTRLYRHLALFVAENLQHMAVEEGANNQALWACYRDDELAELHERLVASIGPQEMMQALGWLARALNPQELAGLLGGMQHKAPPEAFRALLALVRDRLDDTRWAKLTRALGLPPAPDHADA